jgi:hypothetical protein
VSRLKVEVAPIGNRVGAARQRVTAAMRVLTVTVGVNQLQGDVATNELPVTSALPTFDEALAGVGQSSFVLAAAAEAEQARTEVRAAEVKPNPPANHGMIPRLRVVESRRRDHPDHQRSDRPGRGN